MKGDLIGRAHALAVAERELDRVVAGRGGLLLVSGEAGIGKSALAAEVGSAASRRGALVAAAACTDTEGTPGRWPWVQVVRRLARIADTDEWAAATGAAGDALDPLLGERSIAPSGGDESFRLHDALVTLLVTVAARRPVVVVLEDLHHADPASMQVLDFVTRHTWFEPVLVVANYRNTELEAAAHPGRPHLLPLLGRATQLRLTGLDHDGVRELLARAGRDLDHAAVAEVLRRTGGNPFFVEQTALLDGVPSPGVRDVVERRLEVLAAAAPSAVDVLAAVAVAGHAFDPDVPALLTGAPVDPDLVAAEAAALIVRRHGRWAFVHDVVREHLYARLPAGRRQDLHAALVGILRQRPVTAPATLARHARLAVPVLPAAAAVPLLVDAAEAAAARLAAEEAVRHLRDALALIDRFESPDPHLQAQVRLELAAQLDRAGEITMARDTALGVLADAGDRTELRARAALQVHRLGNPGGPGHDEVAMLDAVLPGLADGPLRARVLAAAGMARIHQAVDGAAGVELTRRAVELARTSDDPEALGWSLIARHDGRWEPGTAAERLEILDELAALASTHGLQELEGLAAFLRFVALLERGDPAVQDAFARFRTLTDRTRLPRHRYLVESRSACLALLTGDLDRAAGLIDDARDLGARYGEVDRTFAWRDQAWALHSLRGDHDAALEVARTAVPGHSFTVLLEGLTAAAIGDGDRAFSRIDDVERLMAVLPRRFGWMHLVYLCEVATATRDPALVARARTAAAPVRDAWAVLGGGLVWGPMAHWLARVDAATGRRTAAIEGHTAALRAAQRWGAQPWVQRAQDALAVLDAGEPARPAAQFRRGGEVWTLAFADRTVHMPDAKGLRDIAALLAAPHSDLPAVELLHGTVGASSRRPRTPGADPIIDDAAREAYRRRLTALDAEIDAALDRGDDHRAARLDAERDALLDELRKAAGLAGRTRRLGDERERARQTVTARIRDSIRRLRSAHPELATHLTEAVHTGVTCSYRPTEPVSWQL